MLNKKKEAFSRNKICFGCLVSYPMETFKVLNVLVMLNVFTDPTALSCVILAIYLSIRTAFRTFILQ